MLPLLWASCRIHGLEVSSRPQVAFLGPTQELFVISEKALGLAGREGAVSSACQVICSYVPAPSVEDWVMHFLSSFSYGPWGNPWCSCAGCPAGMKRQKNTHIASWLQQRPQTHSWPHSPEFLPIIFYPFDSIVNSYLFLSCIVVYFDEKNVLNRRFPDLAD